MPQIHPLACVDPDARIEDGAEVGPFCFVGPDVRIGRGTRLISHVVLAGNTTLGEDNVVFPNAVIGMVPQDLKYRGEKTSVEIGNRNHIREHVTIHLGTEKGGKVNGGGVTRLGDDNLLMVNAHVGHDVQIGSRCVIANNAMIAGHVVIGDHVNMMGGVGVHHFVSIGDFAYIGGASRVHHDVPPFMKVSDDEVRALNETGLKRAGFAQADIDLLDTATRKLFISREKPFSLALGEFDTQNGINPHVKKLIEFLRRRDSGRHGRYLEALRQKS
jgi:UDP-N-acetylglucosamine acyltransferase